MTEPLAPEDDTIEIELRPIDEAAARMVILAAVVRRALLELPFETDPDEANDAEAERFDIVSALGSGPLAMAATQPELTLLSARVGDLGEPLALAASWDIEALAALAWATGLAEDLPEPCVQVDSGQLLASVPPPWEDLTPFRASLRLADEETIAFERERAELWSWRCSIDVEIASSSGQERRDLLAILRETVVEAVETGALAEGTKDFIVKGKPFRSLDDESQALIDEIATKRLRALNWLCGFGASWDTVPLDV